jgi:hypothetical protein
MNNAEFVASLRLPLLDGLKVLEILLQSAKHALPRTSGSRDQRRLRPVSEQLLGGSPFGKPFRVTIRNSERVLRD